jgi:hypothetical protein
MFTNNFFVSHITFGRKYVGSFSALFNTVIEMNIYSTLYSFPVYGVLKWFRSFGLFPSNNDFQYRFSAWAYRFS